MGVVFTEMAEIIRTLLQNREGVNKGLKNEGRDAFRGVEIGNVSSDASGAKRTPRRNGDFRTGQATMVADFSMTGPRINRQQV
jgi:hypothetical protein